MATPSLSRCSAAVALLLAGLAHSQTLPAVSISGKATEAAPDLSGFSDPPARLPMQVQGLTADRLLDAGVQDLAGLTRLDASVSDAYNAVGYWSQLRVRGFELDNRFNLRRDGLPISGETALSLVNKAAVELLKGASGMQAGTSAPAGLINLVVKRPLAEDATTWMLSVAQGGTVEASVDSSRRFGDQREFGLRVNLATSRLDPQLRSARGQAHTAALAADWRLSPDTLLEAEVELNRQRQPSQPGFSLLGDRVPDPRSIDPRTNLNNQPWSLPVVFDNLHASLRWRQRLSAHWRAQAHVGVQRLKTDDRVAFPFGLDCNETSTFTGSFYCNRFGPDGRFDLYDFRSENERRNTRASDFSVSGQTELAGLQHQLQFGLLQSQFTSRFQRQAYNFAGVGRIDGSLLTAPNAVLTGENTNRTERSDELYLKDRIALTANTTAWLGLRHSRIHRDSVRTDGSGATGYGQTLTTPWLALSHALSADWLVYASWGQGVESEVTPNRSRYRNAGLALPALLSRQTEIGIKTGSQRVEGALTVFDVSRPVWRDVGSCDAAATCERRADGIAHHRGIEASADLRWAGGGLFGSATRLWARREGSTEATLNGLRPANVPDLALKVQLRQTIATGLQAQLGMGYEGARPVLPDNSISLPGWTRWDGGLRWTQPWGARSLIWRLSIDNLTDRRAWREAPYQFDHSYLYPLAPRTWRASVELPL